jgi:transcriptional regulator with XRE-family HTH domain
MNAQTLLVGLLDDISKAGFSVAQICKAAGVDPSLVSRWKGGRVEPRISSLVRLEAALELLKTQR